MMGVKKVVFFLKKVAKIFGGFKKRQYLCIAIERDTKSFEMATMVW
jgi:hypothetical protein